MRKITFYPHLAITNVLRNNQFYLPYLLTNIATVAMFYILAYLSFDDTLASFPSANNVQVMMGLGCVVVAIFSAILVFYTNSFVMKRRQHELGLYSILGMETRHIARLLRVEALFLGLFSLVCGLAAGIILSKLMLMLLFKLLHFPVSLGFSISIVGIVMSTILFAVLFLLVLLRNLIQLHKSKPVELLRSSSVGEREPKVKWLLALVGAATLVAGYVMANTIQSPLQALTRFFFAVVLVIIGTYCIFTAGSIAVLKLLRANKHYYYKPQHFTTVSGLLYRMKQNAVGLASICILSTMLLVTVSTTVCLYLGVETSLKESFPRNINYTIALDEEQTAEDAVKTIEQAIKQTGHQAENVLSYTALSFPVVLSSSHELTLDGDIIRSTSIVSTVCVITQKDYNRYHKKSPLSLSKGQVACYSEGAELENNFQLGDQTFTIAQRLTDTPLPFYDAFRNLTNYVSIHYLVVPDKATLQELYQKETKALDTEDNTTGMADLTYTYCFDMDAADEELETFYNQLSPKFHTTYSYGCRQFISQEFYAIYGGFLFLGLFLGLLFLLGTVLIIYFKQISEGYDDQKRYEIMQKVGLSEREVRRSVHSQILLVFFLPLVTAMIHVFGAFHMITKMLQLFLYAKTMTTSFFLTCTLGTLAGFAVIYALVYWATAHTYYKIVRMKQTDPRF